MTLTPVSAAIDGFLAAYPPEVQKLAAGARKLLRQALPGVSERLDLPGRLISYGYAPGYKGTVCVLIMNREGVKIGIFKGSELPDPKGLLEGSGKVHRYVAVRTAADLKQAGLRPLLAAALAAWKLRSERQSVAPSRSRSARR